MVGKKAGLGILLAALLTAAVVAPAAAQSQAGAAVGLVRTGTGSFSLDVDGADLRTVLRAISEFSGRNIVVGSNARAVVRIQLKKKLAGAVPGVTPDEAPAAAPAALPRLRVPVADEAEKEPAKAPEPEAKQKGIGVDD